MIGGDSVVALVPARGGSKGVPGKNVRELGSKPLVAWPIDVAKETRAIDRAIVSTDDEEIAEIAREWGAEVSERPARLATDESLVADTVRYTVDQLASSDDPPEYVVMLEPTTPFRRPADIEACLDRLAEPGVDSVATFTDAEVNPHRTWRVEDGTPQPFLPEGTPWQPRQSLPDAYQLNGAVYAFDVDAVTESGPSLLFGESEAVVMEPGRSLDIDTELDFAVAETLLAEGHVRD
ncbi:acylneuraminate cytidylyltransferase family protein [Halomicroarcula sp. F28]|uniref:acylneuraminate cytidylyltransferase family protein n=1 Tax=Haloarcula salinisoli TaxID=2487746 RepID=UPI001C73CF9F|nr:acylneuraminate cytidylyltransferase family protein [Halomicroarcula salinisoli]MBX0288247.1 acylneuraminate cytidylyltransferase family protein [Halomicroarcula salinisoli]